MRRLATAPGFRFLLGFSFHFSGMSMTLMDSLEFKTILRPSSNLVRGNLCVTMSSTGTCFLATMSIAFGQQCGPKCPPITLTSFTSPKIKIAVTLGHHFRFRSRDTNDAPVGKNILLENREADEAPLPKKRVKIRLPPNERIKQNE